MGTSKLCPKVKTQILNRKMENTFPKKNSENNLTSLKRTIVNCANSQYSNANFETNFKI